jgi:hypothetical protein
MFRELIHNILFTHLGDIERHMPKGSPVQACRQPRKLDEFIMEGCTNVSRGG